MRICRWIFTSVAFRKWTSLVCSILLLDFSCKHPVILSLRREVFLLHPGGAFSWMSPSGPPPQLFKDSMIHGVEDFTAGPKPMVVGPSPDNRIELHDRVVQQSYPLMFLDNSSDLLQECFDILFRGSGKYYSILYLRTCCPRKSKPSSICGDDGFLL